MSKPSSSTQRNAVTKVVGPGQADSLRKSRQASAKVADNKARVEAMNAERDQVARFTQAVGSVLAGAEPTAVADQLVAEAPSTPAFLLTTSGRGAHRYLVHKATCKRALAAPEATPAAGVGRLHALRDPYQAATCCKPALGPSREDVATAMDQLQRELQHPAMQAAIAAPLPGEGIWTSSKHATAGTYMADPAKGGKPASGPGPWRQVAAMSMHGAMRLVEFTDGTTRSMGAATKVFVAPGHLAEPTPEPAAEPEATTTEPTLRTKRGPRGAEAVARRKAENDKRGPGRKLSEPELLAYMRQVRTDHPDSPASDEVEYAYWVERIATSRPRWHALWAQLDAEAAQAS